MTSMPVIDTSAEHQSDPMAVGPSLPLLRQRRADRRTALSTEARLACQNLDQRIHRARVFDSQVVDDIAWEMMLDALVSLEEGRANTLSGLCFATQAPLATASRHLNALVQHGLMIRSPDPRDGRRSFVTLSSDAELRLRHLLRQWADQPNL